MMGLFFSIPTRVLQASEQEGKAAQEELQCLSEDLALLLREHRAVRVFSFLWTSGHSESYNKTLGKNKTLGNNCIGCVRVRNVEMLLHIRRSRQQ